MISLLQQIISNKEIYEDLRVEAICEQLGFLEEILIIGRSLGSQYIELNIYKDIIQNKYIVKSVSMDGLDNEYLVLIKNNSLHISELNSNYYPENLEKYFLGYLVDMAGKIPNRGLLLSSYAIHLKTTESNIQTVITAMLNKFNISKGYFRETVGFPSVKSRITH